MDLVNLLIQLDFDINEIIITPFQFKIFKRRKNDILVCKCCDYLKNLDINPKKNLLSNNSNATFKKLHCG